MSSSKDNSSCLALRVYLTNWQSGLYAKYGVEEYWIVDRENLSVMIFCLHDGQLEETAMLGEADEITSPLLSGFALKGKNAIHRVVIPLRFSRSQIIGALIVLVLIWMLILFRVIFSRA